MVLKTSVMQHLGQTLSNKAISAHCLDPSPGTVCLSDSEGQFPDISVPTCHFESSKHDKHTRMSVHAYSGVQKQYKWIINTK